MDPQPVAPGAPASRVAALEGVIAGGTVPGAIVLALGYYLTDAMERLENRIGSDLSAVRVEVVGLREDLTDLRVQASAIPDLDRRLRRLEENEARAATAPRR